MLSTWASVRNKLRVEWLRTRELSEAKRLDVFLMPIFNAEPTCQSIETENGGDGIPKERADTIY